MKRIYKYKVPVCDAFTADLPQGARILSVQVQHDCPQMWAVVDPEGPLERRSFFVWPTGSDMHAWHDEDVHLGTYQLYGGSLVFHLFERRRKVS